MKVRGFSLIELLVVITIVSILLTLGFNAYSYSKVNAQAQLDRQYMLQLPILIEGYFSESFQYPSGLDEFLTTESDPFTTPKNYYIISYSVNENNNYLLSATLNTSIPNAGYIKCCKIIFNSSGELLGYDRKDNDITADCWN